MSTTVHPIEPYAIARLTADTEHDSMTRLRAGQTFTVEDYVPAEETEDGKAYYIGSSQHGSGDVIAYPSAVELHMTREQAESRKPPSPTEIVRQLRLLDWHDGFETDESNVAGMPPGSIEVYGSADNGLRFRFVVTVSDVQITDI